MAVNYSTLTAGKATQGSISNYVNRSDLPVTNILIEAEALIYSKLRVREMMDRDDLSASATTSQVSVPSDFIDIVSLTPYGWGQPLEYRNEDYFQQLMDEDGVVQEGTPAMFTIIGTLIVFDVELADAFGGKLVYYARPAALSTSNETNFLTVRYPTLLRHACMSFAYEHMKDEQRALDYRTKTETEAFEASQTDELFRRGQR